MNDFSNFLFYFCKQLQNNAPFGEISPKLDFRKIIYCHSFIIQLLFYMYIVYYCFYYRFRCKLCKFMAYNKSECKIHLRRVHPATANQNADKLEEYIVAVEPEKMKAGASMLSRVERPTNGTG